MKGFAVVQMTFDPDCVIRPENIYYFTVDIPSLESNGLETAVSLAVGQTREDLDEGKKFYYVVVEAIQVETVDGDVGYMLAKSKYKKAQTFDGLKKVKRVYVEV